VQTRRLSECFAFLLRTWRQGANVFLRVRPGCEIPIFLRGFADFFHWCADCWNWVCDCAHSVKPLKIKRQPVKDVQIRSVGYDRRRCRLEIEFTWIDDVRQFNPVAPAVYRQLPWSLDSSII